MSDLYFLNGQPEQSGRIKTEFSDFIVKEELGYPLTGEGEFVAVKIRKTDTNTLFVGEKLAEFAGISTKQMSYAGLKDRNAITEQWFSLHLAGKETPDFSEFQLENVEVLEVTRHNRKIRIGSLKGNYFEIVLRDVKPSQELEKRLQRVQAVGFPNYFTEQRFGRDGNNLVQAQRWAAGEIKVKDRQKRSFYLSAARSEVFNQIVSDRIGLATYNEVIENDIVQLTGTQSWFQVEKSQITELNRRLQEQDLCLTAGLIGENSLDLALNEREREIVSRYASLLKLMAQQRLTADRRAMFCLPQKFSWQFEIQGLVLRFFLPAGSYATALVRELIRYETP